MVYLGAPLSEHNERRYQANKNGPRLMTHMHMQLPQPGPPSSPVPQFYFLSISKRWYLLVSTGSYDYRQAASRAA